MRRIQGIQGREKKRVRARRPRAAALLEAVLASTGDGVLVVDARGRVVGHNQRMMDLWRLPPGLARERDAAVWLRHSAAQLADPAGFVERVRALGASDSATGHDLIELTDGRVFERYTRPVRGGGRVWSFTDVTEMRLADALLRRSEERWALAASGANDGLWEWEAETGEMHFSARWMEMLGLSGVRADTTLEGWLARVHPDDADHFRSRIAAHLAGKGAAFESEHRTRHAGGGWRWTRVRGAAERDAHGRVVRMAGSQADVTELRQARDELRLATLLDPLTALPNRTLFMDRLRMELRRGAGSAAVLAADVDGFRLVNESLGHAAGDEVLVAVARRLAGCAEDPGVTVARVGGDEFALLVEGPAAPGDAAALAERVRAAVAAPLRAGGRELFLTASVGIALAEPGQGADELLRDAGTAMYRARAAGPGRQAVFDRSMQAQALARLRLQTDLRGAAGRGELFLLYQPVVSLRTGAVEGMEALVRWRHPERGVLGADEFVPLAEETGMIVEVGRWVLREACRRAAGWGGGAAPHVAVNLSARQLAHPGLAADVAAALAEAGLEGTRLRLEITESVLAGNAAAATAVLHELRALGPRVSIDDFGTGYSSLAYLHRFPVDALKVDRSFVRGLGAERESAEIVRTILSLARSLSLDAVAEGIETEEQRAILAAMGCELAQGFAFWPPLDADAADALASAPAAARG